MLKRALIPLCLLVIVVILSGCQMPGVGVGGGGIAGTNGIIIKDFSFDYSPIYAEEPIGITMELQNVGGTNGTVTAITIFGADILDSCPGSPADQGLQWCSDDDLEPALSERLLPPDTSTGFEGEVSFYDWTLRAPSAVKSSTTYDFEVRVDYGYSTTYTGTLQLVKQDYLQTLTPQEREALIRVGGVVDSDTTAGPLTLAAASGRHFIIREGVTPEERTIKFKVTNIGSGYPYVDDKTAENLYHISIPANQVLGLDSCDPDETLSRGKTAVIKCTFDPADVTFTNKIEKQFQITLEYDYYIDSAASITVNPVFD